MSSQSILPPPNEPELPVAPRTGAAPGSQTRLRTKLVLLCTSCLAGLFALELAVRLAGLDKPLIFEPDPQLGWRHIAGASVRFTEEGDGLVRINSHGHRDRERPIEKPDGVFRIVVLG